MFKKMNLFSKNAMKLLEFVSAKDGALYEKQIADGAGVSAGSANALLQKLTEMGMLLQERKGKMLFYRRNDESPLMRQFKVFCTVNSLMPLVRELAQFSHRLVLFGSCAEGRNGEKSDIDLLVIAGNKKAAREAVAENPKVRAIILDSAEYAMLQKNDRPLYDRMRAGLELHGGANG